MTSRRAFLHGAAAGAAATFVGAGDAVAQTATWRRGHDNQRIADLGDGHFLNPVMSGDHPDPTILKDGRDYYMTFSTFDSYPGLVLWHSRDLVNWTPLTAALTKNIGSVWAPELCKHGSRYFLYIPARTESRRSSYVAWADRITGPWSDPIDLNLPDHIDPGHAVGEDGSRWLFLSNGDRVRLADDGLSCVGKPEHVYDPWRYPEDWVVEAFAPEGPKITRHGEYFYLITAIGGTAGPPTGHMVIAARSKSIHGPWEHHPKNPLVRTTRHDERWWSRGHATLVEGPDASWWSVYHGYENGYWTLGRQALLDPVEWTKDGWFEMRGGDLSRPIRKPTGGEAFRHGAPLSDDFSAPLALGRQWSFFKPGAGEASRIRVADRRLHLKARGTAPSSSSPLLLVAGDQGYRFEADIEIDPGVTAGLVLFYDERLYCGLGFDERRFVTHQYGIERGRPANAHGRKMRLRVTNDHHIVTFDTSGDGGRTWKRFDRGMEVSGYHHNVRGGFLMLRPGLYAAGEGEARFANFTFRAG
ncbi:family 43 glycosylhydrolase [Usitatibacter palustris]|uniref:Non-reducing end alpha-L-arabinofuranosidase BoGH43B n=1 Tax=Usitatibacter palustris TaxID=2732487 RepID=A0A6M4H1B6_9PROT|nr:family 43 glycosylhydrolase [Usitatibacter palustris]QJR13260.1 Non-reducing end alpha-L-arabinofuranosidase BoGH43B [Usitatibacter palustris]